MSLNGVSNTFIPNTLSGLESFNATNITINGVDISTLYVPFINSPSDVDLSDKNLTTTGRVQCTVLKLPSLTQSSTKFLQLNANKEVISTDLAGTFVVYTGSTSNLDMGVYRVFTTAVPSFNNELVNKLYVDTTFPNFGYLSANYLTQANASIIYAPIASPTFTGTVSGITSTMVGLGNVDNTSDLNKPVSTATQTALNLKANLASPTFTGTVSGITSTMVGLGNVDNTSDLNKPVSTATQTALNLKADLASPTFTGTVSGITSSMVGLGNVDNTSDANKPVSTATQTALNLKANIASPTFTGTVSGITSTMVGLGNVDNTSDANKPVSTATQTALNLKSDLANPTFTGTVTLPSVFFTSTPPSASGTLLAINGSNQIVTTTSSINQTNTGTAGTYYLPFVASASTGAFVPLVNAGLTCDPSNGLIRSSRITANTQLETFSMRITNVPTGTQQYLLAVDSSGNVIQGTGALQQTQTLTNTNFYVPFVSSFATGNFLPLIYNKLQINPATGLLTTNQLLIYGNTNVGSLTFSTNPATGTVAFYLAIDSTGVVIRTSAAGGDAYLANTQTFTGDNTFSGIVYASRIYAQNTGAVMVYDTLSNFAHQFKVNGNVLAQIGTLGLAVNNIVSLNAVNLVINGNGSGVIVLQASGTTMATIDGTGFNTNQINTYANADLNINVVDSTKFLNFNFNGTNVAKSTFEGFWIPADGSKSYYCTDTAPYNATYSYNRLFAVGGTSYNDFYNKFQFRVYSGISPLSGLANIMALTTTGMTISKSSSSHATLANYELVVGDNSSSLNFSGKILVRGTSTTSGTSPSIDFTSYHSHLTPQASIECVAHNPFTWAGQINVLVKEGSGGASGALVRQISIDDDQGLVLYNSSGAGNQPQIQFAGNGIPNIKAKGAGFNWFINGTQCGYFDTITASAHWRISTDTAQKLILCSGGQNTLQLGNGGLGNYPAEIYGYRTVTGSYWQYTGGGATWGAVFTAFNIGLYVQYTISADGGYLLASDERIKTDIKPAESGSLEVIKTIPIKSHAYIDSFINGCPTAYNVIAQDIQKYYPEAITITDGFIPDMYVKCRWIHVDDKQIEINIPKAHTVIVGDKVKLILEDSTHKEAIVTAIKDQHTFAVEKWDEFKIEISDELFVYGKHVKDFLRVDKIKLGVLALAGVKELNQIVETQHLQIQAQQAKIEEQSQAINTLTESLKAITEHLAKLTTAFNEKK